MIVRKQDRNQTRKSIEPSSRDAISSWLDVLTSMLGLPHAQRIQIRDEMEDHLRSRVDDLLISGLDEHEAVKQAVAELGETAQLAKVVTNAHAHTTPRRRTMQALLIAGALAGMSIGGYSLMTTTPAAGLPGMSAGALVAEENTKTTPETRQIEIVDLPTLMAFSEIAGAFGYAVDIGTLDKKTVSNLQNRHISINGEMTLDRAIQSMLVQLLQHAAELTTEIKGDTVELLTHDEVLRRETLVQTYSLDWSNFETAQNVYHTLQSVVGNGQYSQFFTASFIGNQLVVNARKQAHDQIESILAGSQVAYENLVAEEQEQRRQAIRRLEDEYNRVRDQFLQAKEDLSIVDRKYGELESIFVFEKDKEKRTEIRNQRIELLEQMEMMHFEISEIEERYMYLRTRLLDSQYEDLFNIPSLTDGTKQSVGTRTITIRGQGVRSGEYELPSRITLSRLLISAGATNANHDAPVLLNRLGTTTELGRLGEVISGEKSADIEFFSGDEIVISDSDG